MYSKQITMALTIKNFDDVITDSDGHQWSQICKSCTTNNELIGINLDDVAGSPICGVEGCSNDSDFYVDFVK